MNQQMKALLTALAAILFCLAAAFAAYGMQRSTLSDPEEQNPAAQPQQVVQLYVENGLWGARTSGGRVLAEPKWYYLRVMSDDVLIAKQQTPDGSRTGLIRTNGELLVPFLYQSVEQAFDDLWIAELAEGGSTHYHLYRSDGTRWSDTAWESCETDPDGNVLLSVGRSALAARLAEGRPERTSWHSLHDVGLHRLRLDFDAVQLAALPDSDTLLHLGDAAADYLTYLFIDDTLIDTARFSGENPDALLAAPRYQHCFLQKAAVSRVKLPGTVLTYRRDGEQGSSEIRTAMYLTVSRNAAGGYTYSGFSDPLSEQLR